jgi:carotenoid cleavage dioxygenase-like enzyme
VGWHWSQLPLKKALEVTFTEWSNDGFEPVASNTFEIPNCSLAPHDMAMTENCIVMKINALSMDQLPFLINLKGAAASLSMDGRSPVKAWIFPRPTSTRKQFEPFSVDVPACFSIHFSHCYEDEQTGNIVTFFSGWPPSDSKDFLGAWGGECSVVFLFFICRCLSTSTRLYCLQLLPMFFYIVFSDPIGFVLTP